MIVLSIDEIHDYYDCKSSIGSSVHDDCPVDSYYTVYASIPVNIDSQFMQQFSSNDCHCPNNCSVYNICPVYFDCFVVMTVPFAMTVQYILSVLFTLTVL